MAPPKKPSRGFTLVELVIVVAIIGVLSLVGIPTYKRMAQKAKQAEAKAALGGLYVVEAAFFSEYGCYGTVLTRIGFEVTGLDSVWVGYHPGYYFIGFPFQLAQCAGWYLRPDVDPQKATILSVFPDYFNVGAGVTGLYRPFGVALPAFCLEGDAAHDASTFKATASGVIIPGVNRSTVESTLVDQWSIDNLRQLVNVNDGVQ